MIQIRFSTAATLTAAFLLPTLSYLSPSIEAAEEQSATEADSDAPATFSAKQLEDIKRIQAEAWAISFALDMPSLEPQAVQYTVLDKDPAPGFTAQIKKMEKFNRQQLQKADTKQWKDLVRSAQMEVDWNAGFRDVTGENLWLLTKPGNITLSSNAPAGKKWVVTKAVRIKGQPVCWSIPVEVKKGKHISVTLNKGNTFDLQTPYDDVMKEPDGREGAKEPK